MEGAEQMYKKKLLEIYNGTLTKNDFSNEFKIYGNNKVMTILDNFEIILSEFECSDEAIEKIIEITNNSIIAEIKKYEGA